MSPRMFDVSIQGREPATVVATTRGKALYQAFLSFSDSRDITFRQFLAVAVVKARSEPPLDDGYGYVRRNYGINPRIGQRMRLKDEGDSSGLEGVVVYPGPSTAHVHLMIDGRDFVSTAHPFSVELLPFDEPIIHSASLAEIPF